MALYRCQIPVIGAVAGCATHSTKGGPVHHPLQLIGALVDRLRWFTTVAKAGSQQQQQCSACQSRRFRGDLNRHHLGGRTKN